LSYPGGSLFYLGVGGTGSATFNNGSSISTLVCEIGLNGGSGSLTLSGPQTTMTTTTSEAIAPGWFVPRADVQNASIQLDHQASWTLSAAPEYQVQGGYLGGLLNLSGGTVSVLSGGRLHVATLNESGGSTLVIGLDGESAAGNGQIIIDGNAIFAGTLDVTLENGFVPVPGDQFQVLSFGSDGGGFSSVNLPTDVQWDASQLFSTGILTVVPEPGTATLGAVSLAGMLFRRRVRPGLKSRRF
jgi:hypothetical protein